MPLRLRLLPSLLFLLLAGCGTAGAGGAGWAGGRRQPPPPERPEAPTTRTPPRTPTTFTLGASFAENRGRLPWPADGTVTAMFGPRTESTYGTRTFSPGMDVATAPGAEVRAVFGGTVTRVGAMAAYGTYVMVAHGDFTTVYGNLSATSVASGDPVATGQAVGRAGTDEQARGPALFFAVFEGDEPVDPLGWLAPR